MIAGFVFELAEKRFVNFTRRRREAGQLLIAGHARQQISKFTIGSCNSRAALLGEASDCSTSAAQFRAIYALSPPKLVLLIVFVIVLLAEQLAAVAAGIPIGVKPAPVDPRGCLPLDDRRWVESMQGVPVPELPALSHGEACLDELRFAEALPKLQQAIHPNPSAAEASCNLVALGVAYDGLSRPREGEEAWRHAHGGVEVQPTVGLEVPVLRGDSERAMRILEDKFEPRVRANGNAESYVGSPLDGFIEPFSKALQLARGGTRKSGRAHDLSPLCARAAA